MEGRDHLLGTVCLLGTESGGCVAVNPQGKVTLWLVLHKFLGDSQGLIGRMRERESSIGVHSSRIPDTGTSAGIPKVFLWLWCTQQWGYSMAPGQLSPCSVQPLLPVLGSRAWLPIVHLQTSVSGAGVSPKFFSFKGNRAAAVQAFRCLQPRAYQFFGIWSPLTGINPTSWFLMGSCLGGIHSKELGKYLFFFLSLFCSQIETLPWQRPPFL